MAEQVLIQFRADKELKQEVADIYEQLGMDLYGTKQNCERFTI